MLLDLLTDSAPGMPDLQDRLYDAFASGNTDELKTNLHALYAGIPYNHYTNNPICRYEGFYASVFYACIASLGLRIIPEDVTNRGRIDFTVFINDLIYIFEFKVTDEEPLKQIKEKRYYEKYMDSGKKVIIVGINFNENERNISRMEWEEMD